MKTNITGLNAIVFTPVVLPTTAANPLGAWRTAERTPPHYGVKGTYSVPGKVLAIGTATQLRYGQRINNPQSVYRSFEKMAKEGS